MKLRFKRHKLENVFTPSSVAKLTYVQRKMLEDDVEKFIQIPGMQLILYGYSGCGKTTLISNKLDKLKIPRIRTCCETRTKFEDVISQAFDQLNSYYTSEKSWKNSSSYSHKAGGLGNEISGSLASEESGKSQRALPLQLTPQRLAEHLGKAGYLWIIEDFHKMELVEKKKIADTLKVFMDMSAQYPKVKIICIGAVGTARELVELESNLSTRVAEIFVPLLSDEELLGIASTGLDLLNISFNSEISEKIVHYSNHLAAVCHQICYDICFGKGITKTKLLPTEIFEPDFSKAVSSYLRKNSDTMAKIYDKVNSSAIRKEILRKFIGIQKEFATLQDLKQPVCNTYPFTETNTESALNELTSIAFSEVLRYDPNSGKYSISSPFFHAYAKMAFAIEQEEGIAHAKRKDSSYPIHGVRRIQIDETMMREMIIQLTQMHSNRIIAPINAVSDIQNNPNRLKRLRKKK